MKGLILEVYKTKLLARCANGGISERCDYVTITGPGIPEIFEPGPERPEVRLVTRTICGEPYCHAEPVEPPAEGRTPYMAGGAYVHTSDSRFTRLCRYPIALHDRTDTWADHEILSR
jgi:hypothetical protein